MKRSRAWNNARLITYTHAGRWKALQSTPIMATSAEHSISELYTHGRKEKCNDTGLNCNDRNKAILV